MSAVLERTEVLIDTPESLQVALPVTGELMQKIKLPGAVLVAEAYEIDSSDMAQLAANERTGWAKRIDDLKAMQRDFVEPARLILERAKKWWNPPIADLEAGREILGKKLLEWDQKEKARIIAENTAREAIARKLRQEAEAKAAAERARAEEQAREARRKAEEAERERLRAEAEGNARAAAAAAAARAKAEEAERAAIENGEARAQEAQLQAAAQVAAAPVAEPVKISGQALRDNWIAELLPGITEDQARALIVAEAANRPELLGVLKLDTGAVNKMAKALKGAMRVPGFAAQNRPLLAGARK